MVISSKNSIDTVNIKKKWDNFKFQTFLFKIVFENQEKDHVFTWINRPIPLKYIQSCFYWDEKNESKTALPFPWKWRESFTGLLLLLIYHQFLLWGVGVTDSLAIPICSSAKREASHLRDLPKDSFKWQGQGWKLDLSIRWTALSLC